MEVKSVGKSIGMHNPAFGRAKIIESTLSLSTDLFNKLKSSDRFIKAIENASEKIEIDAKQAIRPGPILIGIKKAGEKVYKATIGMDLKDLENKNKLDYVTRNIEVAITKASA